MPVGSRYPHSLNSLAFGISTCTPASLRVALTRRVDSAGSSTALVGVSGTAVGADLQASILLLSGHSWFPCLQVLCKHTSRLASSQVSFVRLCKHAWRLLVARAFAVPSGSFRLRAELIIFFESLHAHTGPQAPSAEESEQNRNLQY